jgi:serine protease Do
MLGPADVYYRKGLGHYYSGRYSDAIKDFDQTLAMSPDYPGLADLRTSAVNLRQQYGDVSVFHSSNVPWYIVSAVLLVLAVGGRAVFMVVRSHRQRLVEAEAAGFQPVPGGPPPVGGVTTEPVGPQVHEENGAVQPLGVVPAQQLTATEPHFCASCGAEHHPAERFCPNCGKQISRGKSARGTSQIR